MKHKITIKTNPKFSIIKFISTYAFIISTIGIGSFFDNIPMQWMGFILVFLTGLGFAMVSTEQEKGLTPDEAIKKIEEYKVNEKQ